MCSFLACFTLSQQAKALSVDDLRFGEHPGKTRLVLDLSDVTEFRSFVLREPDRLVIDLPSFDWQVESLSGPIDSGIQEVRHGPLEPGFSRIVIDLKQSAHIRSAFLLSRTGDKPPRLVIDFTSTETSALTATATEKTQYFGTLKIAKSENASPESNISAPFDQTLNTILANSPPQPTRKAVSPHTQTSDSISMVIPPRKPAGRTLASSSGAIKPKPPLRKKIIIVDAGHGGRDPGAVGPSGILEKNITLSAARELKKQLEATGRYSVKLTRNSNHYIKLYERVNFARKNKGDLFVSLHADSIGKSNVRGASIYTLSNKASDVQTAKLAARENQSDLIAGVDLTHEDKDVANILLDLAMRDTMNQAKFFANTAVDFLKHGGIRILERPHRYAGFAVLKAPDVPSVLIELGFLSNHKEARLLATPSYQKKIVSGIVKSIDAYFETVDKNTLH